MYHDRVCLSDLDIFFFLVLERVSLVKIVRFIGVRVKAHHPQAQHLVCLDESEAKPVRARMAEALAREMARHKYDGRCCSVCKVTVILRTQSTPLTSLLSEAGINAGI
jgi:hypothetical protein